MTVGIDTVIRLKHVLEITSVYVAWELLIAYERVIREKFSSFHITCGNHLKKSTSKKENRIYTNSHIDIIGNPIQLQVKEVKNVYRSLKNNKVAGLGAIPPELIKYGTKKLWWILKSTLSKLYKWYGYPLKTEYSIHPNS